MGSYTVWVDYRQQFFEESRSVVGNLAGLSVLVVGCGNGQDCQPFVDSGAEVSGLDICEEIGSRFLDHRVHYYRQSIENCDLPSNRFDMVFCIATMEHVHGIERAYSEMVRLVRPGGTVYAVAAPLWNSRRGHHIDCLNEVPWIHLRYGPEEIVALAKVRGITNKGQPVRDVMDFVFVSQYFNRAPAARYIAACRILPVSEILRNDLWLDGAEELSPEILSELQGKGYTREELLATSHTLICRK